MLPGKTSFSRQTPDTVRSMIHSEKGRGTLYFIFKRNAKNGDLSPKRLTHVALEHQTAPKTIVYRRCTEIATPEIQGKLWFASAILPPAEETPVMNRRAKRV